ncbi:hypothetical protein ACRYCC_21000 [Actinomadura scrupuli]|uniref:hypothetical protein n=1 Tax=Actinomadura scrupuli TaxID=559629 RepID=UPI003D9570D2
MTAFWYRPDGRPATRQEAQNLLSDAALRLLAQDTLHADGDIVVISTWFTVFDHAPPDYGRPLLWETVVSDGRMHTDIAHYSTRAQASRGHADAVMLIGHRLRELSTTPDVQAGRARQAVPVPAPVPLARPVPEPYAGPPLRWAGSS